MHYLFGLRLNRDWFEFRTDSRYCGKSAGDGMSTEIPKAAAEAPSPAARRMRLYRKRRREGLRSVHILVRVTAINDFIRAGLLDKQQREDRKALQAVVCGLLRQATKELRDSHPLLVTSGRRVI